MSKVRSYRDESRWNWGTEEAGPITMQQLNCGSLMRIADASELMAKNVKNLVDEIEQLKQSRDYWKDEATFQKRSAASLRGTITKQRAIIAELGLRAK